MSQDSGLGAVVTPDQVLIDSSSEQVLAVRHCNGRDWWIICQNAASEAFYSFLLDTGGIQSVSYTHLDVYKRQLIEYPSN